MMTTGSSAVLRAIFLELYAELRPALKRNTATGDVHTGAFQRELANRLGPCQSNLSRAMPAEWDGIICILAVYQIPTMQSNIEAQFEARAGFHNVIGAIDCTHSAIKAPSHDEFVYQQETFSFHQCTDHM